MTDTARSPATTDSHVLIANPSPDVYGSDLQMLETVSAVRDAGYRVTVALPSDGPLVTRLRARGAEIVFAGFPVLRRSNQTPLAFLQMLLAAAVAIPRLVRLIRRARPDIVYVNTVTLPWWLLASRLSGVPAVCHVHEADDADRPMVRRALYGPLWLAREIIVNGRTARDVMGSAVPRLLTNCRVIYNGVPQPSDEPEPAAHERPFQVLCVGRLSPRKAPHLALEAVSRLRSRGYDVEIELVGSHFPGYEWYVEQLTARANDADLSGAVRFAGYCSPVWQKFERADVVVQPSVRESLGNAVIEAQLSLRPVIATATSGHFETIVDGETGLLFPEGDVEAIADAVARLIDNRDLATAIAVRGRQSAVERFSTARYSTEILAVMDSLVPSAKKRTHR